MFVCLWPLSTLRLILAFPTFTAGMIIKSQLRGLGIETWFCVRVTSSRSSWLTRKVYLSALVSSPLGYLGPNALCPSEDFIDLPQLLEEFDLRDLVRTHPRVLFKWIDGSIKDGEILVYHAPEDHFFIKSHMFGEICSFPVPRSLLVKISKRYSILSFSIINQRLEQIPKSRYGQW